jgi:hypothetical protein
MDAIGTGLPRGLVVAVEAWHRQARGLAGGDASPRWFPPSSRRVPTQFRPPRTCPRQESEFRGADAAPLGTARNSRGTEWGLSRNRDASASSRLGTEWGLEPFTIEQTTEDVTAIHRLAASRLRGRRLSRTGRRLGHRAEIRGKAGATVRDASRTSDQDGPEPGHLTREARSEKPEAAEERSDGERTGPKRWRGPRITAKGALLPDGRGELGRRPEGAC